MKVPNSYFFLNIFKNRLKWIKDPNLHVSPLIPKISQKEGEEVYNVHLMNQQKMQIQIQIVFGFLKMTEYEYYPV